MKIKKIGASPLTGDIFSGTLDTENHCWVGKKTDVTDDVLSAALECMMVRKEDYTFTLKSGKKVTLTYREED